MPTPRASSPSSALVKHKKLVGGGTLEIVNQTVPRALRSLGYEPAQVAEIVAHIADHHSVLGAPHLKADTRARCSHARSEMIRTFPA